MAFKLYNFNYVKDLPKMILIEQPGLDVAGLFDFLEAEYGSTIKAIGVHDGKLAQRTRLAINGSPVYDLFAEIPDGAEVLISKMLPGG